MKPSISVSMNNKPKAAGKSAITIRSNANIKHLCLVFFGIPAAILILGFFSPFFRHVFTFGSVVMFAGMIFVLVSAVKDKQDGVERDRPQSDYKLPKWFGAAYFISIAAISAGMRLGFYIVPFIWLMNWLLLQSIVKFIRATYKPEPDPWSQADPCNPNRHKEE